MTRERDYPRARRAQVPSADQAAENLLIDLGLDRRADSLGVRARIAESFERYGEEIRRDAGRHFLDVVAAAAGVGP